MNQGSNCMKRYDIFYSQFTDEESGAQRLIKLLTVTQLVLGLNSGRLTQEPTLGLGPFPSVTGSCLSSLVRAYSLLYQVDPG